MSSNRRVTRSLPLFETAEKHVTKKEKEDSPLRFQTCPPLLRKNQRGHLRSLFSAATTTLRALSFDKTHSLSKLYDPSKNKSYMSQIFRVCGTIGEGSFGTVYKVICKEDNQNYAVKVSKKGCLLLQNQYEEVRRLEKIGHHENIVKYFFAWEENSMVFMQIELCGTSLDLYAKANHNIVESQQWDILIDILSALKHLHAHDLVHLDIKPDNIMMSDDGLYKLGDFGLLLDLKEHRTNLKQLKPAHISEGDAKYLAREILDGQYTTSADLFSLGITMLELATDLVLPINGPLWHQLRNGTFPDEYFKLVPAKLRTIIRQMMHQNFLSRPSAVEVLRHNHVRKVVAERKVTPRVNYYVSWKDENKSGKRGRAVAVCLNPSNGDDASPQSLQEKEPDGATTNETDEPMDVQIAGDDDTSDSSCITPPRRISEVILYSI